MNGGKCRDPPSAASISTTHTVEAAPRATGISDMPRHASRMAATMPATPEYQWAVAWMTAGRVIAVSTA